MNRYSNYLVNTVGEGDDHDWYRYKTLWQANDYLKYYDCIYESFTATADSISEWRIAEEFRKILAHNDGEVHIKERQEEWILHTISNHAMDESIVILFRAISEADNDIRKKAILEFLKLNSDYEWFKKIPLDPDHWGGSVDSIIPQLTSRILFLESVLEELKEVKYLRHSKRIKDRIDRWKAEINEEEVREICRKLYQ